MRREGELGASVHHPVAAISSCCCERLNRNNLGLPEKEKIHCGAMIISSF
jgi:hypothetical protein